MKCQDEQGEDVMQLMKAFEVETFALITCAQLCFNAQHSESFHKHSKNEFVYYCSSENICFSTPYSPIVM